MLTVGGVFKASQLGSGAALVQNFGVQPLSLASVIKSFEQQRQAYFVKLISPNVLLSKDVNSLADVRRVADSPLGQLTKAEVAAFSTYLEGFGLFMRYVSKDLRRAVIFGDVPSLVSVPAAVVNDGNFITTKDASAGATKVGTGLVSFGTVLITLIVAGPAAAAAGSEALLIGGAVVVTTGAGFLIGYGLAELLNDTPAPPPPKKPSSDNTDFPNQVDGEDFGDVDVPDAVAFGSPDNGIDVDQMVGQLGDGALEEIVSNIPIGWDSDSGAAMPGIGDFGSDGGSGDSGDGGGLFGDLGFG